MIEARHLHTGHEHDAFSTAYFGVPPSRFKNAIEQWGQTAGTQSQQTCRLIDIGCGKGRALLLASEMGFRDVVGVELHSELAAIAEKNIEAWRAAGRVGSSVSVVCADAIAALPGLLQGNVLIYLYNPFRAPVLRTLLTAISEHRHTLSVTVDVLYLYPEHEDVFREFPQFHLLWQRQIPISAEDAIDGLSAPMDPCSLYRLGPQDPANE